MPTIQDQMALYSSIENVLRSHTEQQQPMSLAEVHESVKTDHGCTQNQVKDKLVSLMNHKLVTKVTIAQDQSGNKRSRIGYLWAQMDRHAEDEISARNVASGSRGAKQKYAEKAPVEPSESVEVEVNGLMVYAGRGVQMFVQNVRMVVDKNPDTGLVRIKLEELLTGK